MKALAIIVAGGSGERFGRQGGKQVADLLGRPVVAWAVEACARADGVERIVLVAPADRLLEYGAIARAAAGGVAVDLAESGATRQDSVASGLALAGDEDAIVVHDGARPLASPGLFASTLQALDEDDSIDGVIVAHPSVDTVKVVRGALVIETPERDGLWAVQTPQTFRRDVLVAAYQAAKRDGFVGTDDASLVERMGGTVKVVEGPRDNLKVTRPEDLALAEAVLGARQEGVR